MTQNYSHLTSDHERRYLHRRVVLDNTSSLQFSKNISFLVLQHKKWSFNVISLFENVRLACASSIPASRWIFY